MATQTIDPRLFLKARLRGFTKDIRACSTVDPMTGKPAFFPGLITCFSMLELLSGLYSGDISNAVTIKNILKFRSNFLNYKEYSPLHIRVLHSVMRHKVAHLGHPYYVTDTRQEHHFSSYANHMRITWVVSFSYERPVIEIKKKEGTIATDFMINYLVNYDHVVIIHVASLAEDIVEATHKYISRLEQPDGTILRNRFQNAINKFIQ